MKRRTGIAALGAALAVIGVAGLRGKLRRYEIAEDSMEPQLSAGDYVIAQALVDTPVRGSIVIVPHPDVPHFDLAKRIIGLPGERVTLRNGQVHIDGAVLAEPWADGPVRPDGEWTLAAQEVFVLGDNRSVSAADSRTIGPVPLATIRWKVVARYWPVGRCGRLASQASGR